MSNQWTLGAKLSAVFAATGVILLAISLFSLKTLGEMSERFSVAVGHTVRKIKLAGDLDTSRAEMAAAQRGMIMFAYNKNTAEMDRWKRRFQEDGAAFEKTLAEMRTLLVTQEGRTLAETIKSKFDEWRAEFPRLEQSCRNGQPEEAVQHIQVRIMGIYESLAHDVDSLQKTAQALLDKDVQLARDEYSRSRSITIALFLLAAGFVGIAFFVLRQALGKIRGVAGRLDAAAGQVSAAAQQIAGASQGLAQGATEQSASLEQTSASSEEITSITRKNEENTGAAAGQMNSSEKIIGDANRRLEEMIGSMREINASSEKISRIIKVIEEIAFQTNILALNAAVEAARAGEAGMGFAVVADEVRNLAQRSAQAAKDTAALIEESIQKSGEGRNRLDHVAEAIRRITDSSMAVKTLVDEINLGSHEQARGIEEISKAIVQIEQVTQKTAAAAQESAAASEQLAAQSHTFADSVGELQLMVGGGDSHRAPAKMERPRSASKGLKALSKATANGAGPKPAQVKFEQVSARSDRSSFPLEGDFKEF